MKALVFGAYGGIGESVSNMLTKWDYEVIKCGSDWQKQEIYTGNDIGLIVNCAGLFGEYRAIHDLVAVNTFLIADILRHYGKQLIKGAYVFNITSSSGIRPNPDFPKYSMSKRWAEELTKYFADYYINKEIFINSVAPCRVRTRMRQQVVGEDYLTEDALEPDDVASFILDQIGCGLHGNTFDLKLSWKL